MKPLTDDFDVFTDVRVLGLEIEDDNELALARTKGINREFGGGCFGDGIKTVVDGITGDLFNLRNNVGIPVLRV